MPNKYQGAIEDLRGKRRKVATNLLKSIGDLVGPYHSHVRLSGDKFKAAKKAVADFEAYEDQIRALKSAGR